tara:strand:+ start:110 stop:544 length:435 start_codon:yes stop_codon:yes gene_type:complete
MNDQGLEDKQAKQNVLVLIAAQAILGAQLPIIFVVGGLAGGQLAGNVCFATLPISLIVFGSMTMVIDPNTMREIGKVAKHTLPANCPPASPPTTKIIGNCAPKIACAAISTSTFCLACLSSKPWSFIFTIPIYIFSNAGNNMCE